MWRWITAAIVPIFFSSCIYVVDREKGEQSDSASYAAKDTLSVKDSVHIADTTHVDSLRKKFFSGKEIDTKNLQPSQLVEFSKTLIGVPYLYASTDPSKGFDCSGFITYIFNHFGIVVPRSSVDFTNVGEPVTMPEAKPGDLILFTGTDSTEKFVGHMGLVIENQGGQLSFIHSTSGRQHGVTITPLSDYYRSRYMKTIRVFKNL